MKRQIILSTNKPIIGILLDWNAGSEDGYSEYDWYAIRENYSQTISNAGGIPVFIPYEHNHIEHYLEIFDGVVTVGSDHDINPEEYGEEDRGHCGKYIPHRYNFEKSLLEEAISLMIPILCICWGTQLLNVMLGGSLIQDIEKESENQITHSFFKQRKKIVHDVKITPNTIMHSIVNKDSIGTNSSHHQAIKKLGRNLIVSGVSTDGIIESIEYVHPDNKDYFCLGLQWHPEFISSEHDREIFKFFIKRCVEKLR